MGRPQSCVQALRLSPASSGCHPHLHGHITMLGNLRWLHGAGQIALVVRTIKATHVHEHPNPFSNHTSVHPAMPHHVSQTRLVGEVWRTHPPSTPNTDNSPCRARPAAAAAAATAAGLLAPSVQRRRQGFAPRCRRFLSLPCASPCYGPASRLGTSAVQSMASAEHGKPSAFTRAPEASHAHSREPLKAAVCGLGCCLGGR